MKKILLGKNQRFFKANMHCHTTISDGNLSPEEIKEAYKAKGYSIVAYTDHEVLLDHSYLNDEEFMAITSYEMAVSEPGDRPWQEKKQCHLNLYARDPHNTVQVCFNSSRLFGNRAAYKGKIKYIGEEVILTHCVEDINRIIREGNENGFIVCHNHPDWSAETIMDYINYHGQFAMEIYNNGCMVSPMLAGDEWNVQGYDILCKQGRKIYPICSDDNHNRRDGRYNDSFGGFIMIDAEKLEYGKIFDSLENGDFYASTGPEINSIYAQDGKIFVECKKAQQIKFHTGIIGGKTIIAAENENLDCGEYEFKENDMFVRVEIIDKYGKKASSRAYFLDELTNI